LEEENRLVMLYEYSCVYITVNFEFEKYIDFIANSNNIFSESVQDLVVSDVLSQPIPIMSWISVRQNTYWCQLS
jgi:hypothetical protein